MPKVTSKNTAAVIARAAKAHKRAVAKLQRAVSAKAKAVLPANPKKLKKPDKLKAIERLDKKFATSDRALVDGVRAILESNREAQAAGLSRWAVELSDEDFPASIHALSSAQKERDAKLLVQVEKALARSRASAAALAKKHKNRH